MLLKKRSAIKHLDQSACSNFFNIYCHFRFHEFYHITLLSAIQLCASKVNVGLKIKKGRDTTYVHFCFMSISTCVPSEIRMGFTFLGIHFLFSSPFLGITKKMEVSN